MYKIVIVGVLFALFSSWLYFLVQIAPGKASDKVSIYFPTSLTDLKELSNTLRSYYEENWGYVLLLFCSAYLYKQVFMIPGSALLNILGGAIFGVKTALPLCCILTSFGATCCYLLSKNLARDAVMKFWPQKIEKLRAKVHDNSDSLIYYNLFLRLFPVTPNWLLNLISPIIGIPLPLFFITVLIGLVPYNFICVQAGHILGSISSLDEVFTSKTFLQLALLAVVALGPSFLLKKKS